MTVLTVYTHRLAFTCTYSLRTSVLIIYIQLLLAYLFISSFSNFFHSSKHVSKYGVPFVSKLRFLVIFMKPTSVAKHQVIFTKHRSLVSINRSLLNIDRSLLEMVIHRSSLKHRSLLARGNRSLLGKAWKVEHPCTRTLASFPGRSCLQFWSLAGMPKRRVKGQGG